MEILHMIFIAPFLDMAALPDLFFQGLWDGFVGGTLYALLALGFVLIFKASGPRFSSFLYVTKQNLRAR